MQQAPQATRTADGETTSASEPPSSRHVRAVGTPAPYLSDAALLTLARVLGAIAQAPRSTGQGGPHAA
jgi:hypothetical protein